MADPRFFKVAGPFSLDQLAKIAGAKPEGAGGSGKTYVDVAPLSEANDTHVSFIDNRRYVGEFEQSGAGAVLLQEDLVPRASPHMALLVTNDPYRAYAKIAQAFYPGALEPFSSLGEEASTGSAKIDPTATIGPGAVIGPGAEIGSGTVIGANSVIGSGVVVGANCQIAPSVTLTYCLLGNGVIVHSGVRIGQDGFGFAPGADGHEKVPQLGRVLIGDNVEIGANSTIDRGAGPDTVIGQGTKIDNLVQIGHNVRIGENCLIVAQVGISGSTKIGDFVMVGGQAGISGHLEIGSGARIAAQSGVTRNIPAGATVAGMPAIDAREHWKIRARLNKLARGSGEE